MAKIAKYKKTGRIGKVSDYGEDGKEVSIQKCIESNKRNTVFVEAAGGGLMPRSQGGGLMLRSQAPSAA